jgi:hypothetical protein
MPTAPLRGHPTSQPEPEEKAGVPINRTQALVLGFSLAAWSSLAAVLVAAPEVLMGTVKLPEGDARPAGSVVLVALSAVLGFLAVGVVRRWRWMFWLVLVAFLAGLLRVPVSVMELIGLLPMMGPAWYVVAQGAVGLVQFAIGLAMLSGFRRGGVWGPFGCPSRPSS